MNQLARQLIHVEHPEAPRIQERQAQLNQAWSTLRDKVDFNFFPKTCVYMNIISVNSKGMNLREWLTYMTYL